MSNANIAINTTVQPDSSAVEKFIVDHFDAAARKIQGSREGQVSARVRLASNQSNGVVAYAEGNVYYRPPHSAHVGHNYLYILPQFSTQTGRPCVLSFNDRDFNHGPTEKLALSIIANHSSGSLMIILHDLTTNTTNTLFPVDVTAGVITAIGAAAAPHAQKAFYSISLYDQQFTPTPR